MSQAVDIRHDPERRRWVARSGGAELGFAVYEDSGAVRTFIHTEVDPAHEGAGVGGEIVRASLDDARSGGLRVVAQCPFYAAWIARHPSYADLTSS